MNAIDQVRHKRQMELFGKKLPKLWCPLLTHFQGPAVPDAVRIASHLKHIGQSVSGLLIPGSTGEGWEMSDEDVRRLLSIVLDIIDSNHTRLLIGILKTDTDAALRSIDAMSDFLSHPAVAGITVCAAKNAGSSQPAIQKGLEKILEKGITTALYQLPQVTGNELSPETTSELAMRFDNFVLFKDTSGTDRVALSSVELGNVFLVRGSEKGGYARWTKAAGGPYDGFLLSSANVFADHLAELLHLQSAHQLVEAEALSNRLSTIVTEAFHIVAEFPIGNPFANANKLMDHLFAYGPSACQMPGPMLFSGTRLPVALVQKTQELFEHYNLALGEGYSADQPST